MAGVAEININPHLQKTTHTNREEENHQSGAETELWIGKISPSVIINTKIKKHVYDEPIRHYRICNVQIVCAGGKVSILLLYF